MSASTRARLSVLSQCPECEQRYLDERRCADCTLFRQRLEVAGTAPHCAEPVAITDLAHEEATMAPT
jgi:hypothetical protein